MSHVTKSILIGSVFLVPLGLWGFIEYGERDAPPLRESDPVDVAPAAPISEALARQARSERQLNAANFDLGQRLRLVEEQLSAQSAALRAANAPNVADQAAEPQGPSEADFAQWMEDSLASAARDQAVTDSVNAEATATLAQLPEVHMAGLECSTRFCRATLEGEEGSEPPVKKLFKLPPFATSGFTMPDADGRIALYFTRPGQEIDSLRDEAFREVTAGL